METQEDEAIPKGVLGMSTLEINQTLRWDGVLKRVCLLTRSEDTLPTRRIDHFPRAFVANTSPSDQPGQHWVAFLIWNEDHGEFWDSYGMPPEFYSPKFKTFLEDYTRVDRNHRDLQSIATHVCGQWCLYWLYHRLRDVSQSKTLDPFRADTTLENDRTVAQFVLDKMVRPYKDQGERLAWQNHVTQKSQTRIHQTAQ